MTYLNCPFCPAQAYPQPTENMLKVGWGIQKFQCPARHVFFVEEPKDVTTVHESC